MSSGEDLILRWIYLTGWHGQTALHKACLCGDWSVSYLLLEGGSDPNAQNDFDETPVHYSCKRGLAQIIHLIVQRGGNLEAVDKNGKSAAHHAAQTGSVYVMKFLEMNGVNFNAVDRNLQTPLHICCLHGHVDAFKFLIKAERTNLTQVDGDGNTVLHIAAREGHPYLCWELLVVMGCGPLHLTNREGFTPAELAAQRNKYGHKEITPILQWLAKKDTNYIPGGPVFLWWWLLSMPTVLYAAIALAAFYVLPKHQGMVYFAGMICLILCLMRHSHRIYHVSRWPDPVYAGTFFAGLLHTAILQLFFLVPNCNEYPTFIVLAILFALVMVYLYIKVLRSDPGIAKESIRDQESGKHMTLMDLCVPQRKTDQFCGSCEIVRGPRTKHCRLCEKCYENMDHHCLFLLTCVAKKNHALFCWLIISCLVSMTLFLVHCALYVSRFYADRTWSSTLYTMFWSDCWLLSLIAMNAASIFWGVNLLRFQLTLVSKGVTTVFMRKSSSALTQQERLVNIFYFLIGKQPFAEDPLICSPNMQSV
ncbi:uncharacterized protein LOC125671597 isoform X2 [Ostrea edulis]|uniref:uncharacterized protein LOC125671597 isoform X2 n=1 Tax=Ostrea edulis TaxID=37623 RepID=UPI0024AEC4FC|nr:uncharacterized protein LOC125671597 isoform X2 [Ostrea edulis]